MTIITYRFFEKSHAYGTHMTHWMDAKYILICYYKLNVEMYTRTCMFMIYIIDLISLRPRVVVVIACRSNLKRT